MKQKRKTDNEQFDATTGSNPQKRQCNN